MQEIITICVGGAGVRIGAKFWELLCLEHGISPDGRPDPNFSGNTDDSYRNFFNERESGRFVPRTIFVDSDPTSVDELSTGFCKDLFHPQSFVLGKEEGWGNFARADNRFNSLSLVDRFLYEIERLVEMSDRFQGFLIIHSLGGGTGSGFTPYLMSCLRNKYPRKSQVQFAIYPTPKLSTSNIEPYNAVLSTHYTRKLSDCCFLVDNGAVYDIAQKNLGIASPSYKDLNGLIAHAIANVTASLRFKGGLNVDLNEFQTNLVPCRSIYFTVISYAPIVSRENATPSELNTEAITNAVFDPANQLVKCDPPTGKYMSGCLLYRGEVNLEDANAAIAQVKSTHNIKFVDWCSTDFKVGIINHPQVSFPGDLMAPAKRSVTMLSNTTATVSLFTELAHKFDIMYQKQEFVDLYIGEGMDEDQFNEARKGLADLIRNYEEVGMFSDEELEE